MLYPVVSLEADVFIVYFIFKRNKTFFLENNNQRHARINKYLYIYIQLILYLDFLGYDSGIWNGYYNSKCYTVWNYIVKLIFSLKAKKTNKALSFPREYVDKNTIVDHFLQNLTNDLLNEWYDYYVHQTVIMCNKRILYIQHLSTDTHIQYVIFIFCKLFIFNK